MTADEVIRLLDLRRHPEGGWFRETYRAAAAEDARGASTAVYYLLKGGESAHWHRLRDADEVWHFYAGAPLALSIAEGPRGQIRTITLGTAIRLDERPQAVVPANAWQSARSFGDWSLAGCTVAPAFSFDAFELAPPDWRPGRPLPQAEG